MSRGREVNLTGENKWLAPELAVQGYTYKLLYID